MVKNDIDEYYNSHIKPLYNAIIAFVSKIRIDDESDQAARIYDLRKACGDIVQAVKDVKHLQKNLVGFSTSGNITIKREYSSIRLQLAALLRKIEKIRTEEDEDLTTLSLDELKVDAERGDILVVGGIDHLIRSNLITADMATSLINDSAYLRDIINNLIEMTRILFAPYKAELKEIEGDMALLEDEITAILQDK
jgi:phosphate:Na+ symporter